MKNTQEKMPIPVRLSLTQINNIKEAGSLLGGTKDAEVMRLALEIGLRVLAHPEINYDIAGIVARFAIDVTGESKIPQSGASKEHSEAAQHELQDAIARSKRGKSATGTKASA